MEAEKLNQERLDAETNELEQRYLDEIKAGEISVPTEHYPDINVSVLFFIFLVKYQRLPKRLCRC